MTNQTEVLETESTLDDYNKKEVKIVLGAGGTGSYFLRNLIHYSNALPQSTAQSIVVLDGDIVEEKNLLRQAFLRTDLNEYKCVALGQRYQPILEPHVFLEARPEFVNSAMDLVRLVQEEEYADAKNYTLVSCVDNNMARLRLHIGAYFINELTGKEVRFIDSGNTEWTGQTLVTIIRGRSNNLLKGLLKAYQTGGTEAVMKFELNSDYGERNVLYNQFTPLKNGVWKSHLTRGDHELGCDEITVSNPQNIGTNMTASNLLLQALNSINRKTYTGGEFTFNASTNDFKLRNKDVTLEEGYLEIMAEILKFIQSEEGFKDIFGTDFERPSLEFLQSIVKRVITDEQPTAKETDTVSSTIESESVITPSTTVTNEDLEEVFENDLNLFEEELELDDMEEETEIKSKSKNTKKVVSLKVSDDLETSVDYKEILDSSFEKLNESQDITSEDKSILDFFNDVDLELD